MSNLEDLFQKAKEDASFRQQFIDGLDLKEYSQYISGLKYNHVPNHGGGRTLMRCDYDIFTSDRPKTLFFKTKGIKSIIQVFPIAFTSSSVENFQDFYGILAYHEGFHAKDAYKGMKVPDEKILPALLKKFIAYTEIRAYRNQKKNFTIKNSSAYKLKVMEKIARI